MLAVRIFLILSVAGGFQDHDRQIHLRASAKKLPSKQVIWFRHCIRSTKQEVKGVDGFGFAQNFTNMSLPNWQTPTQWCTQQGADIMEYTGKWLAATRLPSVTSKTLTVISDLMDRDGTTANRLLQGLTLANQNEIYDFSVQYLPYLFHTYGNPWVGSLCSANETLVQNQSAELLKSVPLPMEIGTLSKLNLTRYREVLGDLQVLVGHGNAGPLQDLPPPYVSPEGRAMLSGASVMRSFAQSMMYAFGSGIPYTSAAVEQRYSYSQWIYFYRQVISTVPAKLVVQRACGMLKAVDDLRSPVGKNIIYSGHDGDLDALKLFFQISWEAPPWPGASPTPPGSAVAFTVGPDEVQVDFLYPVFTGGPEIPLHSVPTTPPRVDLAAVEDRTLRLIRLYAGQSCVDACKGAKSI